MTLSLVRWRMSGSKPPSSRQVRWVISSQPVPRWPVVQVSPASSASGTGAAVAPRGRVVRGEARGGPGRGAGRWRSTPAGRARGWCCHSSASTRSTSPERERGQRLLGLGLDELAAQAGRVARRAPHRGEREPQRDRLERRDPRPAGDGARRGGQLGLRELGALEQRVGVADEHERRVGEPDAAAGRARAAARPPRARAPRAAGRRPTGVNCSASATAAIVPRSCSSRSRRSRRRSSMRKQCYRLAVQRISSRF